MQINMTLRLLIKVMKIVKVYFKVIFRSSLSKYWCLRDIQCTKVVILSLEIIFVFRKYFLCLHCPFYCLILFLYWILFYFNLIQFITYYYNLFSLLYLIWFYLILFIFFNFFFYFYFSSLKLFKLYCNQLWACFVALITETLANLIYYLFNTISIIYNFHNNRINTQHHTSGYIIAKKYSYMVKCALVCTHTYLLSY